MSDKPGFVRKPRLNPTEVRRIDRRYRCTAQSLKGLDRGIGGLVRALKRTGELRRTALIFLTDNGYFFGEHRLAKGKARVWEESIRTPLVLRLPRGNAARRGSDSTAAVSTVDVVPTVLELAAAAPCRRKARCRVLDGRSLLGPARGDDDGFQGRGVLIEMDEWDPRTPKTWSCAFAAVRTPAMVYVEHTSVPKGPLGVCRPDLVREHYDLATDPFQLRNLDPPSDGAVLVESLDAAARLDELRNCAGIAGRDRRVGGRPHCE
jgi:N-acetylglucosamine-6-sulfatase